MNFVKNMTVCFATLLCLGFSLNAAAAVPATMTYHGALTDGAGQPVSATIEASFQIFDAETGGTKAWDESVSTIDVNNGSFSVQLGASSPLTNIFDGNAYWLEVSINGESLSPRTPIESVPYAFRAHSADDASKLGGKTSAEIIASAQSGGAASAADIAYDNAASGLSASNIQAALDELAALRARVAALETTSGNHATTIAANTGKITTNTGKIATNTSAISTNAGKITTNTSAISTNAGKITTNTGAITTNAGKITTNTGAITTNAGKITTNAGAISTNAGKIGALETLTQNMKRETIKGKLSVTFNDVNVHVRNGTGTTDGAVNGLGNLIVGYDEEQTANSDKSGSHNLVVGTEHNYTSYGGIVVGNRNEISAKFASVSGGYNHIASGDYSSVSGGSSNKALGSMSSVVGGGSNSASEQFSTVSGGMSNKATGMLSAVSGGLRNESKGMYSVVGGGKDRVAIGGGNWRAGNLVESN